MVRTDERPERHHWEHQGEPVFERTQSLAADSVSPREARRLLREAVQELGHDEWLDAGELAVSEIVTNALLHAHTRIDLSLIAYVDGICVSVRDYSPTVPVAPQYDEQASTGRGLGLVAAVTRACGIQSLGDGKAVWFCIGGAATGKEPTADELLEAWTLDDELNVATPDDTVVVVLESLPPALWLSAHQHHDALLRELVLYSADHPVEVDLARVDEARRAISTPLLRALGEPDSPAGQPRPLPWVAADIDLEVRVQPDDASSFLALPEALDLAEGLAVRGELLVRPGLPEIIAVRDWACEQVVSQLRGGPPSPWPGTAQARFETEVHAADRTDEPVELEAVRRSDRGVVAADEANRIVAVSPSLAQGLGWAPDDLVGRRVVTLIPPHLREAHVAGFSRHLSTGEAHVIGVPLELPVLHADGREVTCRVLIERADAAAGRAIYLAWIDPLPV